MGKLSLSFADNSMQISGSADSIQTVNVFVDTMNEVC
jgi:hypothetical protein